MLHFNTWKMFVKVPATLLVMTVEVSCTNKRHHFDSNSNGFYILSLTRRTKKHIDCFFFFWMDGKEAEC